MKEFRDSTAGNVRFFPVPNKAQSINSLFVGAQTFDLTLLFVFWNIEISYEKPNRIKKIQSADHNVKLAAKLQKTKLKVNIM